VLGRCTAWTQTQQPCCIKSAAQLLCSALPLPLSMLLLLPLSLLLLLLLLLLF
jgi:hypothetical protein